MAASHPGRVNPPFPRPPRSRGSRRPGRAIRVKMPGGERVWMHNLPVWHVVVAFAALMVLLAAAVAVLLLGQPAIVRDVTAPPGSAQPFPAR